MATSGLMVNPYHIMYGVEYPGEDSYKKTISGATKDGVVVCASGDGKEIMDTGYVPAGELVGGFSMVTKVYTDVGNGSPAITMEYWRRVPGSVDEQKIYSCDVYETDGLSDTFGINSGGGSFDATYEYRFIVKTHVSLPFTKYAGVDYIKLIPLDNHFAGNEVIGFYPSTGLPAIRNVASKRVAVTVGTPAVSVDSTITLDWLVENSESVLVMTVEVPGVVASINSKSGYNVSANFRNTTGSNLSGTFYVNIIGITNFSLRAL